MQDIVKNDTVIVQILEKLGIDRGVISLDRTMYKTWLYDWNLSTEIIMYGVSVSIGKYSAMQYLNRVLSEYHSMGIDSVEKAKDYKLSFANGGGISKPKDTAKTAKSKTYSKQELESLYDDITEVII
jgi:DNA replication protein DnaD